MSRSFISPSNIDQMIKCPASVRLAILAKYEKTGDAAKLGTKIHKELEDLIVKGLKIKDPSAYEEKTLIMFDLYKEYKKEIKGEIQSILIEQKLFLDVIKSGIKGTVDCIVTTDKELHIIDFKSGRIEVSTYKNNQMLAYLAGYIGDNLDVFDERDVYLQVLQPDNDCINYKVEKDYYIEWLSEIKELIANTISDTPTYNMSAENCNYCKAKTICPKITGEVGLLKEVVDKDILNVKVLTDNEIVDILDKIPLVELYIKEVKEIAEEKLKAGESLGDYTLKSSKTIRKFLPEAKQQLLELLGDECLNSELKGIVAIEKLIGKEEMEKYTIKIPTAKKLMKLKMIGD